MIKGYYVKITAVFWSGLFVFTLFASTAYAEKRLTGRDWLQMTREEKLIFVVTSVKILRDSDVDLRLPHMEYSELLDRYLLTHTDMINDELGNVFANLIYAAEPSAREGLRMLSKDTEQEDREVYEKTRSLESYYEEFGMDYEKRVAADE